MAVFDFFQQNEYEGKRPVTPLPTIEQVLYPPNLNIPPPPPPRPPRNSLPFLNIAGQTRLTNGVLISPNYKQGETGWGIDAEGNVEFNNGVFRGDVILGTTVRTVSLFSDLQASINDVSADGGGSIYLAPGTYIMTSNIDIFSNVYLIGASRGAVIFEAGNNAYSIRAIGTAGNHITNIVLKDFTVQNSSSNGVYCQYVDVSTIDGVDTTGNLIGIFLDNCSATGIVGAGTVSTSNGINLKITNSAATSIYFSTFDSSTSGHGVVMDTVSNMSFFDSEIASNFGDGINLTNCSNIGFVSLSITSNGGQGIELVSGCNDLQFSHTLIDSNTSDGIKLTATSDRNTFVALTISNNGGWGINIAAASCDNNVINAPLYSANTSGTLTDSGAGTQIVQPIATNTVTSSATPSINTDTTSIFTITALAAAITSMTTNLTGTPVNGQKLIVRILDNGTARAITWGAKFVSRGATLPTTTTLSKYLYVGLIFNSVSSTWDCVATSQEV